MSPSPSTTSNRDKKQNIRCQSRDRVSSFSVINKWQRDAYWDWRLSVGRWQAVLVLICGKPHFQLYLFFVMVLKFDEIFIDIQQLHEFFSKIEDKSITLVSGLAIKANFKWNFNRINRFKSFQIFIYDYKFKIMKSFFSEMFKMIIDTLNIVVFHQEIESIKKLDHLLISFFKKNYF